MERMVLGRTGLETYRLGLGSIPIQRVSEAEAVRTIIHAIRRGVDFIDTSRMYTTSERRIGLALEEVGISSGAVASLDSGSAGAIGGARSAPSPDASRGGMGSSDNRRVILASRSPAKTADKMRPEIEASLSDLQRDYIDIYMCHFVSTHADYETVISAGGALEALLQAKDEGLIGHVGITGHSLDVLYRVLEDELFDTIMVCFSFLESQARATVIPKAREKNIGVIAMKPFSGGVIENPRLALKYVLAEPEVLVLAGVENPELFDEDWKIFQEGAALTEAEKRHISEIQQSYDKVFCRRCDYCQPCSEGISIQVVLGVQSMVKRMGKELYKQSQFWEAVNKGRDCTECGECLPRCPYELPIPDLIRENVRWLDEQVG